MTPVSPSSPDGSQLPPRHRPTLGDLSKDTTESDLWDLDDDLVMPDDPAPQRAEVIRSSKEIPSPREKRRPGGEEETDGTGALPQPASEKIRLNVGKVRQSERSQDGVSQATTDREFDDLDAWDDVPAAPDIGDLHEEAVAVVETVVPAVETVAPPPSPTVTEVPEVSGSVAADDEFSPVVSPGAAPVSLRPRLGLSRVERAGLIALAVSLVAVAVIAYVFSLDRLPRGVDRLRTIDFPVKGALVTVKSATTYWRAPITDGASPDAFRRGTELLPVIEIELQGGPAAIRVLFRNGEGVPTGDVMTRPVGTDQRLVIPATAGFDDIGMHAAYRTGEGKPWTVEIHEARTADTPGRDFKKVFEMNISTDLR
jgi:hypothetical protein